MTFATSLRSEIIKTKRTAAVYLMLLAAFVVPFVLFIAFLFPTDDPPVGEMWDEYYLNAHQIVNFVFIEFFMILASTLLMQTEFKNNSWKQVVTSPQSFAAIYFSKFLILQGLIVSMLIAFNICMIFFGAILEAVTIYDCLSYLSRWPEALALLARTYISTLGMSAFCYWMAFRFRNFIVPTAVCSALYIIGPTVLFEFKISFAQNYVFALPAVMVIKKFEGDLLIYQGLSVVYAIVFIGVGYVDFLLQHVSLKALIPADAIGNPLSVVRLRKSIFLVSWRSLVKDRYYTLINITGLTIGMVSSLFLLIYILDELSYDRFHKNAENIYRVTTDIKESNNTFTWASTPPPLAEEIVEHSKNIKHAVRFIKLGRTMYRYNDKEFYEEGFMLADSTAFDTFSWAFIAGDPATALDHPASIVLTETTAVKYFGSAAVAMGQQIQNQENETYRVTGVLEDIPFNSHFRFNALISISTKQAVMSTSWGRMGAITYLELTDGFDIDDMRPVLDTIVSQKIDPLLADRGVTTKLSLQPITSIHLHSKIADEAEDGGDMSYIYVFSAVAILILVIACINYMNLTTARSMGRIREVGIRKVVGSLRHQLITQFLLESAGLSFVAFGITLMVVYFLLPGFNFLSHKSLTFDAVMNAPVMISSIMVTIVVGILSGSYPALYLSGFNPAEVLKGNLAARPVNNNFRRTLVVLQFSISVFMIIATFIVYNQMEFMRTKDLGFNKEHVLRIPLSGSDQRKNFPILTHQLKLLPEVVDVGMTSATPGERIGKRLLKVENDDGRFTDRGVNLLSADYDYVTTMNMNIVQGRNFDENIPSDTLYAILVNESMVERMGWTDPIGKRFRPSQQPKDGKEIEKRVVGVVKDYNQSSLYDVIEPLIIVLSDKNNDNVLVRIAPGDVNKAIEAISGAWSQSFPDDPFEFRFLDQDFDSQYQADQKRSYIFTTFSVLTMFIACLGLLGLAAFTTEQRTKEIGLRKIAGASTGSLLVLIAKDFFRLIIIAILIAVPLTWYFTNEWLEHFAYRIELVSEWPTFLIAASAAIIITMFTTSYHVVKAARANPVKALRS
ncbi:MAG TPA: ABC transporter permease [Cyclobacteriaceae bacterium]|nr:ABC transporter permease [Cyclobacteriaceae bacterium]